MMKFGVLLSDRIIFKLHIWRTPELQHGNGDELLVYV